MTSYDWIAAVYDKATFVAFDTETTGLKPAVDRVVEIGALKFDTRGIISRMSILINPEMPMPEEAQQVNNITDAQLKNQPVIKTIMPDFLRYIKDCILVIHNAAFDISMMNCELERLGGTSLTNKVFDTLIFAKEVYPGFKSYNLQKLADQFAISVKDAHRATDDARVCMDFFHIAVKHFLEENADNIPAIIEQTDVQEYLHSTSPTFTETVVEQTLF